jgi:GTP-binding protein Era
MSAATPAPSRAGFVAVVGRPNVGKSTLVNALVGQKVAIVSDKPQTTRNRILAVVNRPGGQMVLFDTPGIHKPEHRMNQRMVDLAVKSLEQVDLVLWLADLTQPCGPGDRYVCDALRRSGKPVMLGLNKIDALPKPRILPAIDRYRGLLPFVEVVPLSALTGDNLELLGRLLLEHLPEGPPLYPDDFLTDQPERFFVAEMVREQILHLTRQELPHSTAVVIDSFQDPQEAPPGEAKDGGAGARVPLVRIEASILVERDSQKAIIIGRGGSLLKAIGSAARREIEAFLGARVFLGLFVRVRSRWREDPHALERMGLSGKEPA